ncbi:hypothetical protein A3D69_00815 [Candidatus Uhrbacteria bacterium RIFCSPHIGHO2_02_FULL_54_11]|uniref:Glycosyltransferase 2-like domain-containing protein n=1 Tax=Candidatus Uhrbacteria bacterium GW2011_GWC2_53_7 TaxID=1618986 RepID=A0A0G2APP9_9BACT|nr:MAG: hypothetical protein UY79_C0001G0042 [Parcubacteria group bacterium GW2011_GWA2_53_21]KKW34719.1 MAG: hypothetical protein UY82_C0061G0002 [Candidatus Uhrbacteria bacterium GW2011_GWC2_53_7]OGL72053.1 MAG: hypothetical protein A3D69_00815 [Candidatus Uhrbacteria bacterium RIFCSPHIGHO2_02_FULL_54_11]
MASYGQYRLVEMIPGGLMWATFILAVLFSFIAPVLAITFIIVFDFYWLFRVVYFVIYLLVSWRKYRKASAEDWFAKLERLPGWNRLHHIVFLPMYGEDVSIARATIKAIRDSAYPNDRLLVVVAGEARESDRFAQVRKELEKEFAGVFWSLLFTLHPADLQGEIPGKGSNLNWAGHRVKEWLEKESPFVKAEEIVASAFDVDTVVPPQYFAYLSYLYLTVPNPVRTSYQPLTLFSNNIWFAKAPVRIAAFGTTFWLLTEFARPDHLWTFSSHSMPWKMLLDVGFWQKDIVSEDSRIFLQGLLRYEGDYRVTPMFLGVSMDTVTGKTYWENLKALYKQQRRWAWGVEHVMALYEGFQRSKGISLWTKARYWFKHLEGMYTWATAPILIFLMGWLPLNLAGSDPSVLVQGAQQTLSWIMGFAMIGIVATGVLSMFVLPVRPHTVKRYNWLIMAAQWALLPVTILLFSALPAIDAQTRLMFGKYLGFQVTKKKRG